MRAEPLYRLRLSYRELWAAGARRFGVMEGECDGELRGRFVGANTARMRDDAGYEPSVRGYVTAAEGAVVLVELDGRGRVGAAGAFAATAAVRHVSDDERYARLNDAVCAATAASAPGDETIHLDVFELVWEPIAP